MMLCIQQRKMSFYREIWKIESFVHQELIWSSEANTLMHCFCEIAFFMNLPNEVLYTEMCLCESTVICTDYYIYIESSMYISYEVWCKKVYLTFRSRKANFWIIFLLLSHGICFWVLKRAVSPRQFFWVATTYVFDEKLEENLTRISPSWIVVKVKWKFSSYLVWRL